MSEYLVILSPAISLTEINQDFLFSAGTSLLYIAYKLKMITLASRRGKIKSLSLARLPAFFIAVNCFLL